jgi:hypothetical protein
MSSREAHAARSTPALHPRRVVLAMVLLAAMAAAVGAEVEPPDVVVVVPGLTGSMLRERESQRVVWGLGSNLVRPHDGGYEMARPIFLRSFDESRLEAFEVVREIRLGGLFRKKIYGPVVARLEESGLELASIEAPTAGASLYLFPWDWRLDHVHAAGTLAERLDAIRVARGQEVLRVALICQSNGGLLCRYFAKYGSASLEVAESGEATLADGIDVESIVLVGTANGGSLRNLRELDRGRDYVALIGRKWEPESLFTMPGLFQDLPSYRSDLFVDQKGRPLEVDIFDPESWVRYGWSVFSPRARKRLSRRGEHELFGDAQDRRSFLAWALDRARRLHDVLGRDTGWSDPPRYFLIQNDASETPSRAVLVDRGDAGWRTLFADDGDVRRDEELRRLTVAPGDGHATVESQLSLSPEERDALAGDPLYVRGGHFDLILDPRSLDALARLVAPKG